MSVKVFGKMRDNGWKLKDLTAGNIYPIVKIQPQDKNTWFKVIVIDDAGNLRGLDSRYFEFCTKEG